MTLLHITFSYRRDLNSGVVLYSNGKSNYPFWIVQFFMASEFWTKVSEIFDIVSVILVIAIQKLDIMFWLRFKNQTKNAQKAINRTTVLTIQMVRVSVGIADPEMPGFPVVSGIWFLPLLHLSNPVNGRTIQS